MRVLTSSLQPPRPPASARTRWAPGHTVVGVFQVAGSFGFLFGPLAGGLLVEWVRTDAGEPAWAMIFGVVGVMLVGLGLVSWQVLGALAQSWRNDRGGAV